jgi:WD40 repeat protein
VPEVAKASTPQQTAAPRLGLRWLAALMVVVALLAVAGRILLAQGHATSPARIDIAAGGSEGLYLRMVERYNEHLRPLGVELVPHSEATNAFANVTMLTEGRVQAAFVKGGFAGALRDPEFLTEERIKLRGQEWDRDWSSKLTNVVSLGRVALEPLWVFMFGASETNQLAELDGEPVGLGSMQSGGRTLAALLLEKNGVRFNPSLWLGEATKAEIDSHKPLGMARAVFLQEPAESQRVQALLHNLMAEKKFDKRRNITSANFSPTGRRIAVALGDNSVRVIDAFTGQELTALRGHTEKVNDVAFSADGNLVATGSDDDTVRIWNSRTGAPIGQPLTGDGEDINGVAFSPDGRLIASASESDRATVLDAHTGRPLLYLESRPGAPGHSDDLTSVAFSPDSKKVITASRDGTARLWDAATGAQLLTIRGHTKVVSRAVFSPDGRLIATSSWDNTARIWDAASGRIRFILMGHDDLVRSVEFSPDSKLVVTGSSDHSARVWDVGTGREIRRINGIGSNVNGVGFSPDGAVVMTASQDSTVRIWDVRSWEKVADFHAGEDLEGDGHDHRALHLMDFGKDAEAYFTRFPFLSTVRLPRGAVSFEPHVPAEPVTLLATTVALVVDRSWAANNPSLVRMLTDAVVHKPIPGLDEVTRKQRLFFQSGQFPTLSDPEYDISPLAAPIYRTGDLPFILGRLTKLNVVPFQWAAWLDEHAGAVVLSLIPLLGVLIPAIRALPALYKWTIRRRILYWYRRLHTLERHLIHDSGETSRIKSLLEIDDIRAAVGRIRVPLSYADQYYDLRAHIELVRERLVSHGELTADFSNAAAPAE